MQPFAIVALCIGLAVTYGILLDQITARVCFEYFTIGHPMILPTESPSVIALAWGVIATWWMGLLLGVPLAVAARSGRRPKRDVVSLIQPIVTLLLVTALCTFAAGLVGLALGTTGAVYLLEPLASRVPKSLHARFLADLWAHSTSYLVGFLGGLVVIVRAWRSRGRKALGHRVGDGEASRP